MIAVFRKKRRKPLWKTSEKFAVVRSVGADSGPCARVGRLRLEGRLDQHVDGRQDDQQPERAEDARHPIGTLPSSGAHRPSWVLRILSQPVARTSAIEISVVTTTSSTAITLAGPKLKSENAWTYM